MKYETNAELTEAQSKIVATILALRKLTKTTNTQTSRAQGSLLASLSNEDLGAVSLALAELT